LAIAKTSVTSVTSVVESHLTKCWMPFFRSSEPLFFKMTVPEGFHVELVASRAGHREPGGDDLRRTGRIWITESFEYPRSEAGPGRDRIKVLEDTNGDGRADKVTVFAEGLNIPSGIAVGHGGVWVANAPDILFLQDTDGDGRRPTSSEVVVTGFGRTDTHELPNSLTWGPDGWLYGLNGVFNHSHVKHRKGAKENPDGFQFTCACSAFIRHARVSTLRRGTSNPWGIAWNDEGERVRQRLRDRSPLAPDRDRLLPPAGRALSAVHLEDRVDRRSTSTRRRPTAASLVRQRRLSRGVSRPALHGQHPRQLHQRRHAARRRRDLLRHRRAGFPLRQRRLVHAGGQKTGPDGCLYVLDWYDRYHCYQDARATPRGRPR
jgi:hypothetical protein